MTLDKETYRNIITETNDTAGWTRSNHYQYFTSKIVQPCREEINCETSSTLHWPGLAGRQLGAELSVWSGGGGWWQEAEEAGERDMGSSSSSSPLESSSEWLDSERNCGGEQRSPREMH